MENTAMDVDIQYSRQRYTLGDGAMLKLTNASIFLSGFGALGVEIAKNLALVGIKKLTIHDNVVATSSDLQVNFFLDRVAIDKQLRATGSLPLLQELNPSLDVDVSTRNLQTDSDLEFLRAYQCVILTECPLELQICIDNFCRVQNPPIKFISSNTVGILAWIFCDFGPRHEVLDASGEEPNDALISLITKEDDKVTVKLVENQRTRFETGDRVSLRDVSGMTQLNGSVFTVESLSSSTFCFRLVGDVGSYTGGGACRQVKTPICIAFESLSAQLFRPKFVEVKDTEADRWTSHLAFLALNDFIKSRGKLPQPWCEASAKSFSAIADSIKQNLPCSVDLNYELLSKVAKVASGILPPLSAFIAGCVAQETIKALTAKFTPMDQWFYYNAADIISDRDEFNSRDISDEQTVSGIGICLGEIVLQTLREMKVLMVGCGAIGCEMLKNLAQLDIGCGGEGLVSVADNDLVAKSNLSRQFLFTNNSLQQPKCEAAAEAISKFRPAMSIKSYMSKVGSETEETIFSDKVFGCQDVVISALDNVEGRRYLDKRCVRSSLPMFESGTMGTKGHVQVILPFQTESYTSQVDPVDDDIPYCTLKSFPSRIEHTIEWARDKFESIFFRKPDIVKRFGEVIPVMESILRSVDQGTQLDPTNQQILEKMSSTLQITLSQRPKTWDECLAEGRRKFEKYFNHRAKQLLFKFPVDFVLSDGSPFWQSPRRAPKPLEFDDHNETHMSFVITTAKLLATVWNVPQLPDEVSHRTVSSIVVPAFIPNAEKQVITDERIMAKPNLTQPEPDLAESVNQLRDILKQDFKYIFPIEFEKDDDSNGHINFITVASNLRAEMYGLEPASIDQTRRIAGKIIPAIITTTSAVAGLLALELVRYAKKSTKENHSNCFINLATSLFVFSEPASAPVISLGSKLSFTLWDTWEIRGHPEYTLKEFLTNIQEKYGIEVTMVVQGTRIIYMPLLPGLYANDNKKISESMIKLIAVPEKRDYVELTVGVKLDSCDEDERAGPPVKYYFI